MRIGFIGAGRMGLPMVRRLLAEQHSVVVYAHTDNDAMAAQDAGAASSRSLQEVADDADAVIICVLHDRDVQAVTAVDTGLIAAMKPGSVLVVHTTSNPNTSRDLVEQADRAGVSVVDAAVSGGPDDIAEGGLTLFLGGSDDGKARATEVLAAYGNPVLDVGELGNGQKTKLVNNSLFTATIGLAIDAVRLGQALGLNESTLAQSLTRGSGSSRAVELLSMFGSADKLIEATGEFLAKDLSTMREISDELELELGLIGEVTQSPTLASIGNPQHRTAELRFGENTEPRRR